MDAFKGVGVMKSRWMWFIVMCRIARMSNRENSRMCNIFIVTSRMTRDRTIVDESLPVINVMKIYNNPV